MLNRWANCALPSCRRFYESGTGCGRFCSRTCYRAQARLDESPERMARALALAQALDATDIFDAERMHTLLTVADATTRPR